MSDIYVYSNETGEQVAHYRADTPEECYALAEADWGTNDYHFSEANQPRSNAVPNDKESR